MDLPQFRPNVAPRTSPLVNEIISSPSPSSSSGLPHAVIAIVCILGAAVLLLAYRSLCEKLSANRRGRSFGRSLALSDRPDASLWPIMITRGLQESVIRAIPVFTFSKKDGLVDGCECAVCLCEFEEEESLRLLPKCSHAFHLPCIDQWLQSHSNCPLCRANILSPSWPPSPPTVATPRPPPQENAAQSTNQARNYEAPNSGRPAQQNSDQQRCPADRCSPNTRQSPPISVNLTMREQLGPREAPNTFDREGNRCANQEMPVGSSAFRCYSTGRALNLERMPDGDQTRDASGSMMRRSCSFFSYDRQIVVGNMTEIADVKNPEVSQNVWNDIQDEAEDGMVLQIGKTDSSSDDGRDSKNVVTERSELDENNEDEKCKEEMNDKMLGCRPTVKRSFSAGRLLGLIMLKNSDNIRLPI